MNLDVAGKIIKEDGYSLGLKNSIERLIQNITSTGNINVIFNFDRETEEFSPDYKNIIYSIIREGLTNGIKHGRADEVYINIVIKEKKINIVLKDNGLGCSEIIKGNGFKGIEGRVSKIGGIVEYKTEEGKGFEIEVILLIQTI